MSSFNDVKWLLVKSFILSCKFNEYMLVLYIVLMVVYIKL